jgi:soluble lytic murein transglycosylase
VGEIRKLWANTHIIRRYCGTKPARPPQDVTGAWAALCVVALALVGGLAAQAQTAAPSSPQKTPSSAASPSQAASTPKKPVVAKRAPAKPAAAPRTAEASKSKVEQQLSDLAHELNSHPTPANEAQLKQFATAHARDDYGARAALALGHYLLDKSRPQQAATWLEAAWKSPFSLREYALYWHAQALRQSGRNDLALQELENFRQKYPDSVMLDSALQSLAEAAILEDQAPRAATALDDYPKTPQKPALLLLRADARKASGQLIAAAHDYLDLYYDFPLADESRLAQLRIAELSRQLGEAFPLTPLPQQVARAEALYAAHRYADARNEFDALLAQLQGADNEHAQLRIAECHAGEAAGPSALAALKFSDGEAEAERLYALAQEYRSQKREPEMLDTVQQLATAFPQSHWTEEALFATGNHYWAGLDRSSAVAYYARVAHDFPTEKNAPTAAWRAIWPDYLDRQPQAVAELEDYLQSYPASSYVPDALYFLGRAAERDDHPEQARSFYVKEVQRYPQTYFGLHAADRLQALGAGPLEPADVLSAIPDAPATGDFDSPLPAAAEPRWQRALALRSIAFDASAELELRSAYAETESPRLLLEAALSAIEAARYAVGITLARAAYPQPEAHKPAELPPSVARALYPLPYLPLVEHAASLHHVDPMLVAGIMRQESAFASEAVSSKGAVGLMQVLPKTAPKLAHREKLRYSRARLFDPQYNLMLGTLYVNDLLKQFFTPEAALAAYNAGEDRVEAWQAERKYDEAPEFVESIPFTETRDYVQIVLRNAEMYRLLSKTMTAPEALRAPRAADAKPASRSVSAKRAARGAP